MPLLSAEVRVGPQLGPEVGVSISLPVGRWGGRGGMCQLLEEIVQKLRSLDFLTGQISHYKLNIDCLIS